MAQQSIAITTLPDGKICDFIDQKIRNDTPEEYVRQNIERRLVLELGFAPECTCSHHCGHMWEEILSHPFLGPI